MITYEEFINNILETRGRFACGEEYHERHHIVPKCMGGSNEEENLIDLFAREHFEAHRLLALENPENEKLVYAWWMMCYVKDKNQQRVQVSADEYEEVKKYYSKMRTNQPAWNKGVPMSEEQKKKLSEAKKGIPSKLKGITMSEIAKQHMRENHADFSGENHPRYGVNLSETTKEKIRQARIGKRASEETKRKLSEQRQGELNNFYGKHHSEDSKKKMSNAKKEMYIGAGNPNSKITCQFDMGLRYIRSWKYVKQAANELNINKNSIAQCCRREHKTAGGFIWHYLYDFTKRDGTIIHGAITLGLITEEEALKMLKEQKDIEGEI